MKCRRRRGCRSSGSSSSSSGKSGAGNPPLWWMIGQATPYFVHRLLCPTPSVVGGGEGAGGEV